MLRNNGGKKKKNWRASFLPSCLSKSTSDVNAQQKFWLNVLNLAFKAARQVDSTPEMNRKQTEHCVTLQTLGPHPLYVQTVHASDSTTATTTNHVS